MGIFSFLGTMSPVHIIWYGIYKGGKKVGEDVYGNRYFRAKARLGYKKERRWVRYKGTAEASKVPPEWHGWLHYQSNDIPKANEKSSRRNWQKPHQPNYTGTEKAYLPDGFGANNNKERAKATGDYESWSPPK